MLRRLYGTEAISNLTNLINHKLNLKLIGRDVEFILVQNVKKQNANVFDKEISKLNTKSSKNIAKTLIKLMPETNFEDEEDYSNIFKQLCEYLDMKNIGYNVEELKQAIISQYGENNALQFEKELNGELMEDLIIKNSEIEKILPQIKKIVIKFTQRYFTYEQKEEHITDLKILINKKLDSKYSDEDVWQILRFIEKENNIELFDKEISKLKNKSPDSIAKTLIKLSPETNFEDEEDYQFLLEHLEECLDRKNIGYNIEELKQELLSEYQSLKATNFEEKLSRDLDKRITVEEIEHLDGFQFESLLGELFRKAGYKVNVTKKSGDQGADLIVEKNGVSTAIQAKKYAGSVGNTAVQEVVAAMKYYDCDKSMVITTGKFTKGAFELAGRNGVQLIDKKGLDDLFDFIL